MLTAHHFFICWRLNSIETSSSFHSIGIWCSSTKIKHNWFLTRRSCTRVRGIIPPIGDPCHYWIQKMSLLKGRVVDLPENDEGEDPMGKNGRNDMHGFETVFHHFACSVNSNGFRMGRKLKKCKQRFQIQNVTSFKLLIEHWFSSRPWFLVSLIVNSFQLLNILLQLIYKNTVKGSD